MQLYNSLSRKKEAFEPFTDKVVKVYVCGITPYDTTHLGHAFTYITFDVLVRYLRFLNYTVTYTQNVTDIDDDILKRAAKEGRDWRELGTFWTNKFLEDMKQLHILPPDHYVKATNAITSIIKIIETLLGNNAAYEKNGTVYFSVAAFPKYGQLSKYNRGQMILLSKERGADPNDPDKKDSLDFILWQKSHPGEPGWDSPWGKGRPGWHIECTAMIHDTLGEQIEIHGGGRDLLYPHHESELAQSEAATHKQPFVKHWMHTAMLLYDGEKMSKSLGNLLMVSDLLKTYTPDTIRWVLLSHHYRTPWEFHNEELDEAKVHLEHIQRAFSQCHKDAPHAPAGPPEAFLAALDDDLNTPKALTTLRRLAEKIEGKGDGDNVGEFCSRLASAMSLLGFTVT